MVVDSDYKIETLEREAAKKEFFEILKRQGYDMYDIDEESNLPKCLLPIIKKKDLNSFMEYAGEKADTPEQVPLKVLIPAFMVSELKTAFQMGFMLFLPFLVIDLVTASILMAMGMMMLSPALISLPFKLMLFVLVDGWSLLIGTLVSSFGIGTGG